MGVRMWAVVWHCLCLSMCAAVAGSPQTQRGLSVLPYMCAGVSTTAAIFPTSASHKRWSFTETTLCDRHARSRTSAAKRRGEEYSHSLLTANVFRATLTKRSRGSFTLQRAVGNKITRINTTPRAVLATVVKIKHFLSSRCLRLGIVLGVA